MYLIVITKKRKVGDLLGHAVWKAVEFDVISYKKTVLHLTDTQVWHGVELSQVSGQGVAAVLLNVLRSFSELL